MMPHSDNWPFLIALLLLLTCESYLIIGISTLKADVQSRMRRVYMLACFSLAMWALCFGVMGLVGRVWFMRLFWALGFFASSMFFPSWLHFLTHLSSFRPRWVQLLKPLCYLLSGSLSLFCICTQAVRFENTPLGNQFSYGDSSAFRLTILFFMALVALISALQFKWIIDSRLKRQRRQALVFTILTLLVAPPGLMFDFILPAFFDHPVMPIATVLVLLVSLQLFYTMRVNKGLSITVENASQIIFKSVAMPVLLLDDRNRVALCNQATSDFWGLAPEAITGRNMADMILVEQNRPEAAFFERDFERVGVTVAQALDVRCCEMLLTVQRDKYGDVLNKVVVLMDITQMQTALEQAREASRAKGDFLSRMSHEIRTPMNAIIGMTKIGQSTDDSSRMQYCLGKISEASQHLLGLINDILDMSKIEADKLALNPEPFDLSKMIESVYNVISVRAEEKSIRCALEMDSSVPRTVLGDELRLHQVLTNLLSNAVKFTPEQGAIRLSITPGSYVGSVCFEVTDSGIGIEQDQICKLFGSFEQADGSIARKYGGTGLGLAISKRIVELMGGDIGVDSVPGEGSRFYFTVALPHADPPHHGKAAPAPAEAVFSFAGRRVLLADDIEINREIVLALLEDTGMQIDCAENGKAALRMFETQPDAYDLVLMDVQMPEMDGLTATRRIRALDVARAARIPIIAMTANAFQEDVKACLDAGMNDHIGKPIDVEVLFAKLRTYFSALDA